LNVRRVSITSAAAVVAAALLGACGSPAGPQSAPSSTPAASAATKVSVVASTDVYGSVVSAVGGGAVDVKSIINNPQGDPHEYESTPSDAAAINSAKLVVFNGADYDPFAEKLLADANPEPTAIDVADLSGLHASVPAGEEFNEHVWYNLPTIKKLAETVAADLSQADATQASTFTANAATFNSQIDGLQAKLDAIKAKHSGARVAITEPVPLYMIEAAGLVNATPEEFSEAVEEGSDAPAAVVSQTLALFQGPDAVKVLLANTQTEDAATKQVASAATSGTPGQTEYVGWMGQEIDALSSALANPHGGGNP
jgi:zinc/manganese transport system substrate-binding protein